MDIIDSTMPDVGVKDNIVCIVDRSGSMTSIQTDAQGGLNAFIAEQKTVGGAGANFTLVEFDDQYNVVHSSVDISTVTDYTLKPRGMTALFDAIGKTLNMVEDHGGKNIVVIVTDGMENSSVEYTQATIFNMITEHRETGWEFVFLAANQDAMGGAAGLGMDAQVSTQFTATSDGVRSAYAAAATYATSIRTKSRDQALADYAGIKSGLKDIEG